MEQQLVGFLIGRLAIVSRDDRLDAVWDQGALELIQPLR